MNTLRVIGRTRRFNLNHSNAPSSSSFTFNYLFSPARLSNKVNKVNYSSLRRISSWNINDIVLIIKALVNSSAFFF